MNEGFGTIVVKNPRGKHSLGVGILNRLNLIIEGSLGYFGCRPDRRPERAHPRPRRLVLRREHDGRHGGDREERRLDLRRGDARRRPGVPGAVGSRTGIDMKGGTIIVGGDTGAFSGFMMQRGRMVVCGNAGKNLGDSMYDGTIYVGGEIQRPRRRRGPGALTELDKAWLDPQADAIRAAAGRKGVDHFTKIVAGKQLWNYDNLEPAEKKLIL